MNYPIYLTIITEPDGNTYLLIRGIVILAFRHLPDKQWEPVQLDSIKPELYNPKAVIQAVCL